MKLVIFNGSPRYKKSNSKILIEHFLNGYGRICPDYVPVHYLAKRQQVEEEMTLFRSADVVLVVFPLYTDCMPGIVKEFFENISVVKSDLPLKMGFVVQSGFPEVIHSVFLERYLGKFTKNMNIEYLGTVIKGGVEGIQIMPPLMTKKLFFQFEILGEYFARYGAFSPKVKKELGKPLRLSFGRRMLFSVLSKTGLTNFYWNSHLKKNNAYHKRFDKPFDSY